MGRFLRQKEPQEVAGSQRRQLDVPPNVHDLLSRLDLRDEFWLTGCPVQIGIEPRGANPGQFGGDEPVAPIAVGNTSQTILAMIYPDHLNDISHAVCRLNGCQKIYEIASKHKRQYCSWACAHNASTRRRRAAKAKTKSTKS